MKPILSLAAIIMKATNTYKEGYISLSSGYFWSGLIYNISISISLYALAMFWVCMSQDLQPFRPMPKFLCIKGIIFASYWQGFFLSILVFLKAIPDDVPGYTPDNLAAAIQDALISFEMPAFAIAHWYAFSWHDYADPTISAARLPIKYALRDAFGPVDLIQDTKETFGGGNYDYRHFDARDSSLAHEDSASRQARMKAGMRYERGGKGKYWLPESGKSSREPLLSSSRERPALGQPSSSYGAVDEEEDMELYLSADEERLYDDAKQLEFGDWNYPVITAHTAQRESLLYQDPAIVTSSTNRNILQPTKINRKKRKQRIDKIQESVAKGKATESTSESPKDSHIDNDQLVDLVVEDEAAEEIERVRHRKEGSSRWNKEPPKHYVRTYPADGEEETVRDGSIHGEEEPNQPYGEEQLHNVDQPIRKSDPDAEENRQKDQMWENKSYGTEANDDSRDSPKYGSFSQERDIWGSSDPQNESPQR
jgi:hypothetical protein